MVSLPDGDVPLVDVVKHGLGKLGGELIGTGMYRKEIQPEHPLGGSPAFYEFNCTAVELSVDEETGHITIHKHVIVGDTGKSLNPQQVAGQDEGAAIMGLGHTLMEHMILDDHGFVRNLGAIDYRIPTSMDLPLHMESAAVENEDGPGPYGSKGVSEGGLLSVQSAVGSAVTEATGVVFRELPLTPERVWRGLRDAARTISQPTREEEEDIMVRPAERPKPGEVGPIADMPAEQVVKAASMIKQGKMISLAASRFTGMPLFPGHPPFQVLNAVSPRGIVADGRQPWGPVNDTNLGYMAEYLMCTSHSGAHIDALGAHDHRRRHALVRRWPGRQAPR